MTGDAGVGVRWDPEQYLRYADERARPFADLLARVHAEDPGVVVDLGCGPGTLTVTLLDRWPHARVEGIDSSAEMVGRARELRQSLPPERSSRLAFRLGDVRGWAPDGPVDVLLTNATLQWVPGHLDLLAGWVGHLAPGGWLGLQVPGNFDSPSHQSLFALAAEEPWVRYLAGPTERRPSAPDPDVYLDVLSRAGCRVDAWETTYLHVLTGEDPVFEWVKGTGARPVLQALPDERRPAFEQAYKARLRKAYPPRDYGTVLPYRRIFVVAQRGGE